MEEPTSASESITLKPIEILTRPNDARLPIVDGPTALGYIFSIAIPTVEVPTMGNYFLPLLKIYAKCIFLAYICGESPEPQIKQVPFMSCVMYIAPEENVSERPVFFLGSSWSVDKSPAEEKKRRAVDPWRKEMLAVSLEQLAKDQGDLMKSLPVFEPSYLKQLCTLFWKNLNGKGEISGGKPVVPLALSKRISEQAIWGHDDSGSKHLTILPGNHSFYQSTIPILMPLLENVIISKFEAGPVNTPNVIQALMALFQYIVLQSILYQEEK